MEDFISDMQDRAQGANLTALVLAEADPLEMPTVDFELSLDTAERDEILDEFEEDYMELGGKIDGVLEDWDTDRKVVDGYYWNRKLLPLIDEGAKLHERFVRTMITWVVNGTKINGEPLETVCPEVKEWMMNNYNPNGPTFSEKFGLRNLPMNLQEDEMAFDFDTNQVNDYLDTAGSQLAQNVQTALANYNDAYAELSAQMDAASEEFDEAMEEAYEEVEESWEDFQDWLAT